MIDYNHSLNDLQVKKSFSKLIAKTPALSRRILGYICNAIIARSVTVHLSGQTLKRKTGTLAKSLNYTYKNDYSALVGTNVAYAAIHEFGGVITPKVANALRFKIKDQWVVTKQVIMPERKYLLPSIEYVMTNEAIGIINRQVEGYINKEWKV